ncbi:hypothetical protein I79_002766 [Cricetulus griseus]|uniref:Uncharacterized protein n=1 Tax=Cricetulus griseus TaxID=10029 RepID=G3GY93_CRIGR|nr:hypothetical protein I79_002766 [Cricetulus griseus]
MEQETELHKTPIAVLTHHSGAHTELMWDSAVSVENHRSGNEWPANRAGLSAAPYPQALRLAGIIFFALTASV